MQSRRAHSNILQCRSSLLGFIRVGLVCKFISHVRFKIKYSSALTRNEWISYKHYRIFL